MAWSDLFALVKEAVFGAEDVLSNRRKQPRIILHLPVRCRLETTRPKVEGQAGEGPEFPGELVDLGLRGMRLVLPQRVRRDQMLVVSALPGDGIAGRPELRCGVIWCRQNSQGKLQAGVVYKDTSENLATSWVHYLLLQRNCPVGERKDRRVEAALPVEVADAEGQALVLGQVLDLSLGGAKLRVPSRLPPMEKYVLKIGANHPRLKAVELEAQMVAQIPAGPSSDILLPGQSESDQMCSFRFAAGDSQIRPLKRLLLSLLKDLRKQKRPRSAGVSGVRLPPTPPPPPRPQGPLASAVSTGFVEEPPRRVLKGKKHTTSKFLRSQPPDFMRPAPAARPEQISNWEPEPQPKWRVAPDEATVMEEMILSYAPGATRPPRRSLVEGMVAVQFARLEVHRGWFHPSYMGTLPLYAWLPDQVPRPTEEFFLAVAPMMPGCALLYGLRHLSVWTRNTLGPGLVWADRQAFASLQDSLRRPLDWILSTVSMRERLERRHLSLQERLLHLLAVQGLGGVQAVRSLVTCAQVACAIAREMGFTDTLELNNLRLAALLKDVGESALILGLAPRSQRERWSFFLHGVDTPSLELEELMSDWPGFHAKSDLLVSRYSPGLDQIELLPLHSLFGQTLLNRLGFPEGISMAVRSHHEAYNGSGYPDGLAGREIPWSSRCLAVADTFAGLLAEETTPAEAMRLLEQASGQMFDAELVQALRRYLSGLHLC